jgi:hypothetical protein
MFHLIVFLLCTGRDRPFMRFEVKGLMERSARDPTSGRSVPTSGYL